MDNYEVIDCLTQIRVRLDWQKAVTERWPIGQHVVSEKDELANMYVGLYSTNNDFDVCYRTPEARPFRVNDVARDIGKWPKHQGRISLFAYSFIACTAPVKFILPAYQLPGDNKFILDGAHRAVALVLADVKFEVTFLLIRGPIDCAALPDLIHWMDRPGA